MLHNREEHVSFVYLREAVSQKYGSCKTGKLSILNKKSKNVATFGFMRVQDFSIWGEGVTKKILEEFALSSL